MSFAQKKDPKLNFQAQAINISVYLLKIFPTKALQDKTPYEA